MVKAASSVSTCPTGSDASFSSGYAVRSVMLQPLAALRHDLSRHLVDVIAGSWGAVSE